MEEITVINTTRDGFDAIGTAGLGPCIAIGARGINQRGESILGLAHYSANQDIQQVVGSLLNKMLGAGAEAPKFYLVGGMIGSKNGGAGTIKQERALLGLREVINIDGARLHTSSSEIDDYGQRSSVDFAMSSTDIVFRRDPIAMIRP